MSVGFLKVSTKYQLLVGIARIQINTSAYHWHMCALPVGGNKAHEIAVGIKKTRQGLVESGCGGRTTGGVGFLCAEKGSDWREGHGRNPVVHTRDCKHKANGDLHSSNNAI